MNMNAHRKVKLGKKYTGNFSSVSWQAVLIYLFISSPGIMPALGCMGFFYSHFV